MMWKHLHQGIRINKKCDCDLWKSIFKKQTQLFWFYDFIQFIFVWFLGLVSLPMSVNITVGDRIGWSPYSKVVKVSGPCTICPEHCITPQLGHFLQHHNTRFDALVPLEANKWFCGRITLLFFIESIEKVLGLNLSKNQSHFGVYFVFFIKIIFG